MKISTTKIKELENEISKETEKTKSITQALTEKDEQLSAFKESSDDALNKLRSSLDVLKRQLESSKELLETTNQQLDTAVKDLEVANAENAEKTKRIEQGAKAKHEYSNVIIEKNREIDELTQINLAINHTNDDKQAIVTALTSQVDAQEDATNKLKDENQKLTGEISKLQQKRLSETTATHPPPPPLAFLSNPSRKVVTERAAGADDNKTPSKTDKADTVLKPMVFSPPSFKEAHKPDPTTPSDKDTPPLSPVVQKEHVADPILTLPNYLLKSYPNLPIAILTILSVLVQAITQYTKMGLN